MMSHEKKLKPKMMKTICDQIDVARGGAINKNDQECSSTRGVWPAAQLAMRLAPVSKPDRSTDIALRRAVASGGPCQAQPDSRPCRCPGRTLLSRRTAKRG